MPLYSFSCNKCDNEFDEITSYEDKQNKKIKCHDCGSKDLAENFRLNMTSSRNISGRNVTGALRDQLKAIDKGYSKSTISDSVNLGSK